MGIGQRGRRAWRWLPGVVVVAAGGLAWAAGRGWDGALLAVLGLFLTVVGQTASRNAAQAGDLDLAKVADRLADLVRDQWAAEVKRRELGDPPLAVFWQPASPSVVQPWPYLERLAADGHGWPVRGTTSSRAMELGRAAARAIEGPGPAAPPGAATGPASLTGGGGDLLAVYDRTPMGRLVVLGGPGAGKTVLLVRLVLDLLTRRGPGEPVPLLIPLASWNPHRQDLYDWLEGQILQAHPQLSAVLTTTGQTRARALLTAGLILPVLDGLDEIRAGGRDRALAAINASLRNHTGVVLSCREKAFRHAVRPRPGVRPVPLEGAAGIRVAPLSSAAVVAYLDDIAGHDDRPARWSAVRAALADADSPVAQALTTPLMVGLAAAIYHPRPGEPVVGLPDPAELCSLPTRSAVERRLFDGFLTAAYRPGPDHPARWSERQATRYLTFLAHHLEHRLGTTSLAWWELPQATPRSYLRLMTGILGAASGAVVFGLFFGDTALVAAGFALLCGLVAASTVKADGRAPRHTEIGRPRRSGLMRGLRTGIVVGLVIGLVAGVGLALAGGPAIGINVGLMVAVSTALGAALMSGFRLDTVLDVRRATDPHEVLRRDRCNALALWLVGGGGSTSGSGFGIGSAWGQFTLARIWLAARGHQPLRLIAFLRDAHARGVLRQAGAVWEFRHANLQRHLADRRR